MSERERERIGDCVRHTVEKEKGRQKKRAP